MKNSLNDLRKNYTAYRLDEQDLPDAPLDLFKQWFDEVSQAGGVEEVNAMTLSTVDKLAVVRSRVVLLKDIAEDGFVFYTNYNSDKAQALAHHPAVCLYFFWPNVERQVLISGMAKRASDALSDAYFSSRPRGSQLGAHVSPQSQVIESRQVLSDRLSKLTAVFKDKAVPRPSDWGGIVVVPNRMEFWQGRPNRLHDRIVYIKSNQDSWTRNRLAP